MIENTETTTVVVPDQGEGASTALILPEGVNLAAVYTKEGEAERVICYVEQTARTLASSLDPDSTKGRKEIRSVKHKAARSKTAIQDAGVKIKADAQAIVDAVNAVRRTVTTRIDNLGVEIMEPVVKSEAAEAERAEKIKRMIDVLEDLSKPRPNKTASEIYESIAALNAVDMEGFAEYITIAQPIYDRAKVALDEALEAAIEREEAAKAADAARVKMEAELAELRREKAEREAADKRAAALAAPAPEPVPEPEPVTDWATIAASEEATTEPEAEPETQTDDPRAELLASIRFEAANAISDAVIISPSHAMGVIDAIERGDIPHVTISLDLTEQESPK